MNVLKKTIYFCLFFSCNLGASFGGQNVTRSFFDFSSKAQTVELPPVTTQKNADLEDGQHDEVERPSIATQQATGLENHHKTPSFLSCCDFASKRSSVTTQESTGVEGRDRAVNIPSCRDCKSKLAKSCESRWVRGVVALTICAGIGLGLGFGLTQHTYRVYNRYSRDIIISYGPGCQSDDGQSGCEEYISPGKHAVIKTAGELTDLCAIDDSWSSSKEDCTTTKGLKGSYTWNVHKHHGGLSFGRGKYPSSDSDDTAPPESELIGESTKRNLRRIVEK